LLSVGAFLLKTTKSKGSYDKAIFALKWGKNPHIDSTPRLVWGFLFTEMASSVREIIQGFCPPCAAGQIFTQNFLFIISKNLPSRSLLEWVTCIKN
jgi:hypothetical protein